MRKSFKRITAILLSVVFVLSVFPPQPVFASYQDHIGREGVTIRSLEDPLGSGLSNNRGLYHFYMQIDKPTARYANSPAEPEFVDLSSKGDSSGSGDGDGYATHYDLFMRNATTLSPAEIFLPPSNPGTAMIQEKEFVGNNARVDFSNNYADPLHESNPRYELHTPLALQHGSIYEFRVLPIHWHRYRLPVYNPDGSPSGSFTNRVERAPYSTNPQRSQIGDALYLTDIRVEAVEATPSRVVLEWDNPVYDGMNIFHGYNIYWTQSNFSGATPEFVDIDDPNLEVTPDGKLRYTVHPRDLAVGRLLRLRVEPVVSRSPLRQLRRTGMTEQSSDIFATARINVPDMVGQQQYSIAFTNNQYETSILVETELTGSPIGGTSLRLNWSSLAALDGRILKIEMYETEIEDYFHDEWRPDSGSGHNLIATFFEEESRHITELVVPMPRTPRYYMLYITYEINGVLQDPGRSTVFFYDPLNEFFTPYKPVIFKIEDTKNPNRLDVTFQALTRPPYNSGEQVVSPGLHIDRNVMYRFWVSDNINTLSDESLPPILSIPAGFLGDVEYIGGDVYAYNTQSTQGLTEYYDQNGVVRDIVDNKVYYIKIIGDRTRGQSNPENPNELVSPPQSSLPAQGSHFIAPTENIFLEPFTITSPPLRVKGEDTTEDSITVQWESKWFEAHDPVSGQWYQKIGVMENGNLVYGDDTDSATMAVDLSASRFIENEDPNIAISEIRQLLSQAGANADQLDITALRVLDLGEIGAAESAQYEVHVAEYALMLEYAGGYAGYLRDLRENDALWQALQLAPVGAEQVLPEQIIRSQGRFSLETLLNRHQSPPNFGLAPLQYNTGYVVFFRPFVVRDRVKVPAYNVAYVVETTRDVRTDITMTPTVPSIEITDYTDHSISLKWEYTPALSYILRFSESIIDYADGGTVITNEQIMARATIELEDGVEYLHITLDGFFPLTAYHFWLRSYSEVGGLFISEPSNPVSATTRDVEPPSPPRSLWLATESSINSYNRMADTDIKNREYDYLVLEWFRVAGDSFRATDSALAATSADNTATLLMTPEIRTSYMVQFSELIPNSRYYARAKTIYEVSRNGLVVNRNYYYRVQISPTADFKDVVEIFVPPFTPPTSTNTVIIRESEWTKAIEVTTGKTTGEYDGDKDPDLYPLPIEDFEIIYEPETGTLVYRFRSMGTDATGADDNSVDQRLISRLVQDRAFELGVDVSIYESYPVHTRVIELPYSIFATMQERKISLKVNAKSMDLRFQHNSLNTASLQNLSDFGLNSTVRITLEENRSKLPDLDIRDIYAVAPQTLSVEVSTPTRNVALRDFAQPIDVILNLESRNISSGRTTAPYVYDTSQANWKRVDSDHNYVRNTIDFQTYIMGGYGAISTQAQTFALGATSEALNNVNNVITIRDLNQFTEQHEITANQFNNIIAALFEGQTSISITEPISNSVFQNLGRAQILVSGSFVPREAGINALVRLYEQKQKSAVRSTLNLDTTGYPDIRDAAENFQTSLLKAEQIGFLENSNFAAPKRNLTFAEVIHMANIIIEDTMY